MSVLDLAVRRGARPVPRERRAKRTYKPAADRRREILGCALAAFAERGYHQTSIADVCARAQIGRATLYQYFADKRALLLALAEGIAERVVQVCNDRAPLEVPDGFRPSPNQMVRFIERRCAEVLSAVFESAETAELVLHAARGADGVVDEVLARIDHAVLDRFEHELRVAKEAGAIRDIDVHFVARFFLGGIEKIVLSYVQEHRPIDIAAIAHEAALLEGFGVFPRSNEAGAGPAQKEK
jgi:AcrR family transcriptional regulator